MKSEVKRLGSQSMRRAVRGFSLVELALVMAAAAAVAVMLLPATNTMIEQSRRKETRAKLEALEQAFVRYVMLNRRLPCPADGRDGINNANSGVERWGAGGITAQQNGICSGSAMTNGVVPWRSLGMPVEAAVDAWGNLITYRTWADVDGQGGGVVKTSLTKSPQNSLPNGAHGLDMSECKPGPSTALPPASPDYKCNAQPGQNVSGSIDYVVADSGSQSRGFRVCDKASCPASEKNQSFSLGETSRRVDGNGVAFFLISHGENEFGAYKRDGRYVDESKIAVTGNAREIINSNKNSIRAANVDSAFYIDGAYEENKNDYFDDIVVRPTVISLAIAAGLGPRPQP